MGLGDGEAAVARSMRLVGDLESEGLVVRHSGTIRLP
jgi:hypothetical protein